MGFYFVSLKIYGQKLSENIYSLVSAKNKGLLDLQSIPYALNGLAVKFPTMTVDPGLFGYLKHEPAPSQSSTSKNEFYLIVIIILYN